MSPTVNEGTPEAQQADGPPVAPHPSFIQVANPYIFEKTVQDCFAATGVNSLREDSNRLQGITWIDNVRKALHLPVRTFNTASIYYHKFRLVHPDNEYNYIEAAAAALFTACKIEDTLKKSRDILCCSYNLKLPPTEQLSADDPLFETHSRAIIGLERLMLESSGFDFRNRHPQKVLMKLTRQCGLGKDSQVGRIAYTISLDLYRTFAPLKQTSATMAFACLELAGRLLKEPVEKIQSEDEYKLWETSRAEVMETILDLLELYTHNRASTSVGPDFSLDLFLNIRIPLNEEADANNIPRFAYWKKRKAESNGVSNGTSSKKSKNSHHRHKDNHDTSTVHVAPPVNPMMPTAAHDSVAKANERSRDTAIRFMLNPEQAQSERETVAEYFKVEMEEYEVEE
ncbi:RNA polymerase II C-terminal domain kinase beta subunit [Microsporum canis]|uniref:RNA polymerase II holoenzyme cyclin-like subunit n=1 Tax=Arthroderma otae (strain ATCC MYA-4605 / CBS 113480) TaxID=554155 RepID=C5FRN8_ARTOC|nr:C-type cyclin [Microsporum canis CBS 113480]EEQ32541.1 C-type cyclin [Microsporum canis CBS 113480]